MSQTWKGRPEERLSHKDKGRETERKSEACRQGVKQREKVREEKAVKQGQSERIKIEQRRKQSDEK